MYVISEYKFLYLQAMGVVSTWDKQHYKDIYEFMMSTLSSIPFQCVCKCPFEWAKIRLPLVSMCVSNEDYEGAQATKDAIKDFLNRFLPDDGQIKDSDTLILPPAPPQIGAGWNG